MKSKDILYVIDKYINKYLSEKDPQYETIYRISSSDVSALGPDFIRDDTSRVFFCFYRLTPEQYDNGKAQNFADAFFINGDSLKNGKIKLELNINMPVRVDKGSIKIDKPMIAEILTHELTHAYRKTKELEAEHYKKSFPGIDFIKGVFNKKEKRKYNLKQRTLSYIRTIPQPGMDSKIIEMFKWVGYTMVEDEMYANLAGIEIFLLSGGNFNESRGKLLVDIIKDYLNKIEKNATKEDWLKCMNEFSYISPRKNETVERFSRRWIRYYKDRLDRFDKKVEKLIKKYSKNKSVDRFKSGTQKIITKQEIRKKDYER